MTVCLLCYTMQSIQQHEAHHTKHPVTSYHYSFDHIKIMQSSGGKLFCIFVSLVAHQHLGAPGQ